MEWLAAGVPPVAEACIRDSCTGGQTLLTHLGTPARAPVHHIREGTSLLFTLRNFLIA
jgi:hypothetical protein